MDPSKACNNLVPSFIFDIDQLYADYKSLDEALAESDPMELSGLLDRGVSCRDDLARRIWEKFPDIAIKYLDAYPKFAAHCPKAVLERNHDNVPLITKLFNLGLEITKQDYVEYSVKYPKIVAKVLEGRPDLAKECPPEVFEHLEAWPQTERIRKIVLKAGANVEKDESSEPMEEDFASVTRSFKKVKVRGEESSSDEEMADVQFDGPL